MGQSKRDPQRAMGTGEAASAASTATQGVTQDAHLAARLSWAAHDTQPTFPPMLPSETPTPAQVVALVKHWLRRPTWDIEYTDGYQAYWAELARWHDAHLRAQARKMGISPRMASILEDIVKGWLLGQPVDNELARILLRQY